jgi:hypothetical protein
VMEGIFGAGGGVVEVTGENRSVGGEMLPCEGARAKGGRIGKQGSPCSPKTAQTPSHGAKLSYFQHFAPNAHAPTSHPHRHHAFRHALFNRGLTTFIPFIL